MLIRRNSSGKDEIFSNDGRSFGILPNGYGPPEENAEDEEIWRTNEEGRHFKFETTTGEIKAGFGGKLTGRKIGEKFTPNPKKSQSSGNSKSSAGTMPRLTETQKSKVDAFRQKMPTYRDTNIGRAYGRFSGDLLKANKFLKEYETYSDAKKQEYAGVRKSYLDSMAETQAQAQACQEELKKRGLWDEEQQDVKQFPTVTPQQDKSLKRIEKRIANLKNEQSFIVGPDGEILAQAKGDKHSVGMTVGTKREHLAGAISLHNHPEGGTFSFDDLDDFGFGATETHVSSPEGTYILRNQRYGRGELNGGWLGMRDALQKAVPSDVSAVDLMKRADANLKGNETRRKMDEIAQTWVKMKNAGASDETLKAYFDESGYDELTKKAQKERKDEIRRLEVEPFHEFYKQHAAEYGFEYEFVPAQEKKKPESPKKPEKPEAEPKTNQQAETPKSIDFSKVDKTAYRKAPTMKTYDRYAKGYKETFAFEMERQLEGYESHPEQVKAVESFIKNVPKYESDLKETFKKHDFSTRTDERSIMGILRDGVLKSQIETGTSNGTLDDDYRKRVTNELFNGGSELDIKDDEYETYGYLDNADRANLYGDCRVVLRKDRMYGRTTFTIDDSLAEFSGGNWQVPTLVSDPKMWSYSMEPFGNVLTPVETFKEIDREMREIAKTGHKVGGRYVELQFHGKVTTSDIDYIEVPKNAKNRQQIEQLANRRGVKIVWKA